MSATNAPFGLRPAYAQDGDAGVPRRYTITGAYGTTIYKGSPVVLNTNGTITLAAVASDWLGSFAGCDYIDSTGKPNVSNFWPASQAIQSGTAANCYIYDDPTTVFDIQADATQVIAVIGDQADFTTAAIGTGTALTGLSLATFGSPLGATVQGQMRVVGLEPFLDNAWGDAFPILQVQNARHQFIANKAAI